jgi:hypothetical protein
MRNCNSKNFITYKKENKRNSNISSKEIHWKMQLKPNNIYTSLPYQMEEGEIGIMHVPAQLDQSLKAIAIF